ncbi:hypothetical protein EVAR_100023_1 [Eumeta japonica]|uniref:Uncharacterized protein n=1 Tax=Eumeta variegata TaxID=151549 RepID=A0A4C1ZRI2_EUMVA|nr:hypothetical protein EVAR_100023_1 [Eumeta japonica]
MRRRHRAAPAQIPAFDRTLLLLMHGAATAFESYYGPVVHSFAWESFDFEESLFWRKPVKIMTYLRNDRRPAVKRRTEHGPVFTRPYMTQRHDHEYGSGECLTSAPGLVKSIPIVVKAVFMRITKDRYRLPGSVLTTQYMGYDVQHIP